MIRRSLIILIMLATLLLAALPVSAATPQGTITGTVTNGTTNVVPDQPLTATLKVYLNGNIANTQTTQTSDNGTFSFTDLDTSTDYSYLIQVSYNGNTFSGEQLTFPSGQTTLVTKVSVYETTSDISVLSISMGHIVIYTSALTGATSTGAVTVTEVYYITNNSDRAYTGQVSFNLPASATPTDMGTDLSWTAGAVVDSSPIPPGQTQIDFTYSMPQADSYVLDRTVPLPTSQMDVLVQSGIFTVTSPQLSESTAQNMGGASFDDYTSNPLQMGDTLAITLTSGTTAAGTNRLAVWLAVIGVIVVVLAGIFFFRFRANRAAPVYVDEGTNAEEGEGGRWDELLDELASLDDQRDAGTISEENYRTARDRAKAELKKLMGRENDGGSE